MQAQPHHPRPTMHAPTRPGNAPGRAPSRPQGCWQLAGGHGREVFDDLEAKLAAHAAAGFTTFDTADIYGPSEREQPARMLIEAGAA